MVKDSELLYLVDGGENGQNIPLAPLLQPERHVDIIIAVDSSATGSYANIENYYPDFSSLRTTYEQSLKNGLTRMPLIEPSILYFVEYGKYKRPVFFGCEHKDQVTIVYLPNMEYTYPSDIKTGELKIGEEETDKMIENGMMIATKGGDEKWAECLGCVMLEKVALELPEFCEACLNEYCEDS